MASAAPPKRILPKLKQWRLDVDVERIAWLTIDTPKASVNTLSRAAIEELERIVQTCEDMAASDEIVGLILLSGKESGFIAGADVSEFDEMSDPAILPEALKRTHAVFQRIEDMKVPVAAGIHGFCLGGGLELALACHYRIAVNNDKTRIGFPEVKLGIFPGFGGTGRSICQAGPVAAMQLMLTGRYLRAGAARGMGLVDKLVRHRDQLRWAARKAVLRKRRSKPAGWTKRVMAKEPIRGLIASRMRAEAAKKARPEHYPAPGALIDLFERHGDDPNAMSAGEIEGFVPLMATETAANLRRVFFLSEGLKRQGLKSSERPDFRRVHVVGAGVMGGDIAAWCALRGMAVTLQDLDMERIEPALARAKKLFARRLKGSAVKAAEARLKPDVNGDGIARADVIIEAVVENLTIKHEVFADVEARAKPEAILATNTSSIELERIAEALKSPERLIGLHFFNPVAQLPLVEVVHSTHHTDEHTIRLGCSFVSAIGKSPVVVKSVPGFLVNRVLVPYMIGAVERVERGESKELIDAAAVAFGMPMGPIELMDTVGLDIGKSVAEELGNDLHADSQFLALVAAGKLGRKTGEGFYRWHNGKAQKGSAPNGTDLAALGRELVKPLVDECEVCAKDRIVASADLVDIGVIFGTGFAPFLGGPLKARADGKA